MSGKFAEPDPAERRRISVKKLLKFAIAAVVAIGLGLAAKRGLEQWQLETSKLRTAIRDVDRKLERVTDKPQQMELRRRRAALKRGIPSIVNLRWDRIVLASLCYGLGLFPSAMLLRQAVRSFGQVAPTRFAVASQLLGHLGKYVPGKAVVVVLRVGALRRCGVTVLPATISVFMETLLMMAVGAAVAGLVIGWLPVPRWMVAVSATVAVVAAVPTLPGVLQAVARRIVKLPIDLAKSDSVGVVSSDSNRSAGGWPMFFAGWGWSLLSWLLIGAGFTLLLTAIPSARQLPHTLSLYPMGLAAISLAMVVGFASLLPGGVGARELVLTTILSPAVGTGHALLAAVAARLMFLVTESLLGGAAWLWLRRQPLPLSDQAGFTTAHQVDHGPRETRS